MTQTTETIQQHYTIDPEKPSIYLLAHRNPSVPKEHACLEDYNLLTRDPDNLKYLFIRPQQQELDEDKVRYEIKQYIFGHNIYDAGQLGSFISEYLNAGQVDEDGNVIEDVTTNIDKLTSEFFTFQSYDDALSEKARLIELQNSYHNSLITSAQEMIQPIEVEIIDLILLIAEFTNRVILIPSLENPDRLEDLHKVMSNMGIKNN